MKIFFRNFIKVFLRFLRNFPKLFLNFLKIYSKVFSKLLFPKFQITLRTSFSDFRLIVLSLNTILNQKLYDFLFSKNFDDRFYHNDFLTTSTDRRGLSILGIEIWIFFKLQLFKGLQIPSTKPRNHRNSNYKF